jgi:hypothetical protein
MGWEKTGSFTNITALTILGSIGLAVGSLIGGQI